MLKKNFILTFNREIYVQSVFITETCFTSESLNNNAMISDLTFGNLHLCLRKIEKTRYLEDVGVIGFSFSKFNELIIV